MDDIKIIVEKMVELKQLMRNSGGIGIMIGIGPGDVDLQLKLDDFRRVFTGQTVMCRNHSHNYDELFVILDGVKVMALRETAAVLEPEIKEVVL